MADIVQNTVSDDELVARIVSKEWVIEGTLMPQAFELAPKETYLSVNRLSVASYEDDVCKFVKNHPLFLSDDSRTYQRAVPLGNTLPEGISAEMVLQQIQWELLELAELQECKITEGKQELLRISFLDLNMVVASGTM